LDASRCKLPENQELLAPLQALVWAKKKIRREETFSGIF